ncbi:MAG: DUF1918 domain-containing protein [Acidimicrobiia bacterium]
MRAVVGDRSAIKGHHVGDPDRNAVILEVRGEDGGPPWMVRWSDDGPQGLFLPARTPSWSTSRGTPGGLGRVADRRPPW